MSTGIHPFKFLVSLIGVLRRKTVPVSVSPIAPAIVIHSIFLNVSLRCATHSTYRKRNLNHYLTPVTYV